MRIDCNQALVDLSNEKEDNFTLKKGSGKNKVKDEARSEERKHESRKHRKKEGREKSNAPRSGKILDKWLDDETKNMKKKRQNARNVKGKRNEMEGV